MNYLNWQNQDPQHQAEREKYGEGALPSRHYLAKIFAQEKRPLALKELMGGLGLSRGDKIPLRKRLNAMVRDGVLLQNRRESYCLVDKISVTPGVVIAHKDGFGFVKPDAGGDDIFLSHRQMRSAMHGDRVAVRVEGRDRRGRPEGRLVDILERKTTEIVGRFAVEKGIQLVIPDNPRLTQPVFVSYEKTKGAKPGQIVLVDILEYPSKVNPPIGKVAKILGEPDDPGLERLIAILSHGLPYTWSKEVKAETHAYGKVVREEDKKGRVDLRNVPLVTIDGSDAKDFDDAVYVAKKEKGWTLIVAIADVSHYVKIASALDKEAEARGTSVYFANKVVPMLPEALSNGLCSLNPNVDRLCMVCEIDLDESGKVNKSKFYQGVMHSAARLTYQQVNDMLLEDDEKLQKKYKELLPHLKNALALYRVYDKKRKQRGAMDFDMPQMKMDFDAEGKVSDIHLYERNPIHKMIEEFMIAANVEAAKFLGEKKIPALYRVHAEPDQDRMEELSRFLNLHGLSLGKYKKLTPKHFAKVLAEAKGLDSQEMIETMILRSMARAVYSPDNIGHFGLAHADYAHFTSPIRRYPDLLVHRGIRHILEHKVKKGFVYSDKHMQSLGEHCSLTERRADDATREATDWLKCEFMSEKVGQEFAAVITSVQDFGLFVEIPQYKIEGLVHVTSLDNDYYRYERDRQWLRGEHSGKTYKLRDDINVRLVAVDMLDKKMEFEIVGVRKAKTEAKRTHRSKAVRKKKSSSSRAKRSSRAGGNGSTKKNSNTTSSSKKKAAKGESSKKKGGKKNGSTKQTAVKKSSAKSSRPKKANSKKTKMKKTHSKKNNSKKTTRTSKR